MWKRVALIDCKFGSRFRSCPRLPSRPCKKKSEEDKEETEAESSGDSLFTNK